MVSLEELTGEFESARAAWESFTQNINNFSMDAVINKFKAFTSQMNKSLADLNASIVSSDKMAQSFNKVSSALGQIITVSTKFDAFNKLSIQGGHASSTMVEQFDLLVGRFGSFERAASQLAGKVSRPFDEALKGGAAATRAYLEHVSSAEQLENAYLSLQGATGQLGKEFEDLANLDKRLARFNVLLQDAAGQSNKTLGEVARYTAQLGAIPGVMDQTIDTGTGFEGHLTSLIGSLRLAAGSGRSVEEVTNAMAVAYEKLGNPQGIVSDNAQKGAQLFALMSDASQKLNLRFTDTQGYLTQVADTFKHIGDNTQSATNILARFTGALQNTGLTAAASVDIVKNMVNSIKDLEMGTKALISARTGGPGGLQGAFRVENLLRQGKVDEVAKMLEQTLRSQFQGRIYSQEEASQSPQAAAQFMRQRTLLQSGAFGSLARTPEDATRLLEALKSGPVAATPVIEAMSAVKETTGRGNEIQERQFTALNRLNSGMDRLVSINEARFKIDARRAIGTGEENEFSQELKKYRDLNTQQALQETRQKEPLSMENYVEQQTKQGVGDAVSTFSVVKNISDKAADTIKNAANGIGVIAKETKNFVQEKENQSNIEQDIENSRLAAQRGQEARQRTTVRQIPQVNNLRQAIPTRNINPERVGRLRIDASPRPIIGERTDRQLTLSPTVLPTRQNIQAPTLFNDTHKLHGSIERLRIENREQLNNKQFMFKDNLTQSIPPPNMQDISQQAMQQPLPTLNEQLPKATETMKHEVSVAPLEVKIKVETEDGLKVQTTTNNPPNTTVETINSVASRGGIRETLH